MSTCTHSGGSSLDPRTKRENMLPVLSFCLAFSFVRLVEESAIANSEDSDQSV